MIDNVEACWEYGPYSLDTNVCNREELKFLKYPEAQPYIHKGTVNKNGTSTYVEQWVCVLMLCSYV